MIFSDGIVNNEEFLINLKNYLAFKLTRPTTNEVPSLKPNTSWKKFSLDSLFELKKGKRLTKADMTDGSIPYFVHDVKGGFFCSFSGVLGGHLNNVCADLFGDDFAFSFAIIVGVGHCYFK